MTTHKASLGLLKRGGDILSACLLLLGLISCTGKSPSPTPTVTPLPLEATITFEVHIPANTPPEQGVSLVVLDEVTGLALNPQAFPMEALDATHYRIRLSFPTGTLLKYRYERQGEFAIPEYNTANRQVRYRIFHVINPASVQDSVARWADTAFEGTGGRVQGRVLDAASGAPLPDILITCAGLETRSAADGSFILEEVPSGTHWLTAAAPDGGYTPFQQQAEILPSATTPALIAMPRRHRVTVTFIVRPPADLPALLPIRLADNLAPQNTFADLQGGISTPALRLPLLTPLPNGRHTISLQLPAGADLRYKYTLGDGYWNAERDAQGRFLIRRLLVPDHDTEIQDTITSWYDSAHTYLSFDVYTPPETPSDERVTIQFSTFGWMEPLPMWQMTPQHWVYFLFSPLQGSETLNYRYCRNGECGLADASDTAGTYHQGHTLNVQAGASPGTETIPGWQWWHGAPPPKALSFGTTPRVDGFATGVAFTSTYRPAWRTLYPDALAHAAELGANRVVLSPTWHYTRNRPPTLEPQPGLDASWDDWREIIAQAMHRNLQVALYPQPQSVLSAGQWWQAAPQDDAVWWQGWFETYRRFALHHAQLAEESGAQTLILGGEWVSPALPGAPHAPEKAEANWRDLLAEVRLYYHGELRWALNYQANALTLPAFLDAVDGVYVLWNQALTAGDPPLEWRDLSAEAGAYLDEDLEPVRNLLGQSVWLSVAYPAAPGSLQACTPAPEGGCLPLEKLLSPPEGLQALPVDGNAQEKALRALAFAVEHRPWIHGFFVRGTYPAAALQGPGTSIYGQPAEEMLRSLFALWLPW
ncbi:MAG: hypothetical protein Fur0018_04420 [Anaerolineales bacterium]